MKELVKNTDIILAIVWTLLAILQPTAIHIILSIGWIGIAIFRHRETEFIKNIISYYKSKIG